MGFAGLLSWTGIFSFAAIVIWITGIGCGWWVFRPVHSVRERWKQRKEQD